MSDSNRPSSSSRSFPIGLSSKQAFAMVLLIGIIVPGFFLYLFESANRSSLGTLSWVLGYGTTIFVLWYVWIRPLDLTGPQK